MSGQYSAIDLFCGAGGLSVGLQWAGFDIQWALDRDDRAAETYHHNHPHVRMDTADITDIEFPDLDFNDGLDLLAGGPPCPTFSLVGRAKLDSLNNRGAVSDDRHQLWHHFLRAIDHYEPRAFVMENVKGMASAENESGHSVLSIILDEMRDLGYRVDATVVDAADFGVPQNRERLFILGNRLDQRNPDLRNWHTHRKPRDEHEKQATLLVDDQPDPAQQTLEEWCSSDQSASNGEGEERKLPWVTVADAILDLPPLSPAGDRAEDPHPPVTTEHYELPPVTEYQQWARDIPEGQNWNEMSLYNHRCRYHNMTDLAIYKLLGTGTGWRIGDLQDELQPYRSDVFADSYTKQNPTEPASTITAHMQKDGHMHIHPSEARSLTVREAARLQSFRDSFRFPVPRTAAYRQVGNAVPPLLAQRIAEAVKDSIL